MKSRASLMLMEQLVMVLVFALAASLCLGLFVKAEAISAQTARRDQAVLLAQNAAELLKSGGSPEKIPNIPESYAVRIQKEAAQVPGLVLGTIEVSYEGEILFTLRTGWQEVAQ